MSSKTVEWCERKIKEAKEKLSKASEQGDFAAFQAAEDDVKNYESMLSLWVSRDE